MIFNSFSFKSFDLTSFLSSRD